jgi:hypothetical protein
MKKCKLVKKGKKAITRCCTWFRSCISNRCTSSGRKCSFVGKAVKLPKGKCTWRRYKKNFKRQYCCRRVTRLAKHAKKHHGKQCVWRGKKVRLSKTYWKKQRACGKQLCCFRLYECKRGQQCVFKKNVGCTPRTPKGHSHICTAWGSGHVTPFAEKTFSFQTAGDHNLISSKAFSCHIRVVAGKNIVRTRGIACRVNGVVVTSSGRRGHKYRVGGKKVVLKAGQVYKLAQGGFIKQMTLNTFIIDSNTVGFVEASFHHRFASVVARVRNTGLFSGLCLGKKSDLNAVGIFKKNFRPKRSTLKRTGCPKRKQYVKECSKISNKRTHIEAACIFDRCRGLKLSVETHMNSEKKAVRRLPLKTCRYRRVPHKHAKGRKGCKGLYCCTTTFVARGKSKSKCHFTNVKCSIVKKARITGLKKHTGIFRHVMTGKCGIQTKYTMRKNVGILTGVAVQCGKSRVIVSTGSGAVKARLNGKKFNQFTRQSKALKVKRTHKNSWKVVTKRFTAKIIYNKHLKSLHVSTKMHTKSFTGFLKNRKFRLNRVGKKGSWFKKWIAYVKLSGKGFNKYAAIADRLCRNALLKKSCRKAVRQTGTGRAARNFARKNRASNKRVATIQLVQQ